MRRGAGDRAVHGQHGPAPPRDARGAAAARDARGRVRPRAGAARRLRPHRHREELRGPAVLEGHHVRRADGLPRLLLQRARRSAWRWSACSRRRFRTRAHYLRVLHLELERIASHLFWLGTSALDLGAISMLWYALRDRDMILDLFEMSGGQRLPHPLHPGGWRDGGHPAGLRGEVPRVLPHDASASTSTRRSSTATRSSCGG